MNLPLYQRTLANPVSCSGVGVHSGKDVRLTVSPAPVNHGIKFVRTDLPDCPSLPAHFNLVVDTSLATVLGHNGFIVSTIEHLSATFAGMCVDNALVEMDAYEAPIMDGSAAPFAEMLRSAGIEEQDAPRFYFKVTHPIELSDGDRSVIIRPAPCFEITCSIDFDHPLVRQQTLNLTVDEESFRTEIAPARTFGFLNEIEYLIKFGFARGGSLDNVVVIDRHHIVNEEGLRFEDEFVRHKILDCIGDFSLLGMPILGHVHLHKTGHAFNHAFLKTFFSEKACWVAGTLMDTASPSATGSKSLAIS